MRLFRLNEAKMLMGDVIKERDGGSIVCYASRRDQLTWRRYFLRMLVCQYLSTDAHLAFVIYNPTFSHFLA